MSGYKTLIFTDASLEGDDLTAGVGMVAFVWKAGELAHRFFFSERVPPELLSQLQSSTPKVIAALELLAGVMAIDVLQPHLSASRVFMFIDNEAARANLISMSSPVVRQARLLRVLHDIASRKSLFFLVSRVPSASNIADEPSRFCTEGLCLQGFKQVRPRWQVFLE